MSALRVEQSCAYPLRQTVRRRHARNQNADSRRRRLKVAQQKRGPGNPRQYRRNKLPSIDPDRKPHDDLNLLVSLRNDMWSMSFGQRIHSDSVLILWQCALVRTPGMSYLQAIGQGARYCVQSGRVYVGRAPHFAQLNRCRGRRTTRLGPSGSADITTPRTTNSRNSYLGGVYGSGVPIGMGRYLFRLASVNQGITPPGFAFIFQYASVIVSASSKQAVIRRRVFTSSFSFSTSGNRAHTSTRSSVATQ
jgi:hypothetical protein